MGAEQDIGALVGDAVILSGAKNLALDFSAEKRQGEMLLPQGGISMTWGAGSAQSRFSETLRLFLQIRPRSSAGSSTPSLARVRFGLKVALRPPVNVHTRPRPLLGALGQASPHWVEVNVFHFLVIFLNAWQSAVEKSRLPEKPRSPLPALTRRR